jgi:hypothetical protein
VIGRIVHHHHQNRLVPPSFKPVVVRAVQLHHLAKTFPAFTPGSVLLPRAPNTPDALFHQPAPQGFMIHYQAFLVHLFGRQRGTEIRITLLVAGQHLALQSRGFAPRARLAPAPMHQS